MKTEYTLQAKNVKPAQGFSKAWRDCLGGHSTDKALILARYDARRMRNQASVVFRVVERSDKVIVQSRALSTEQWDTAKIVYE